MVALLLWGTVSMWWPVPTLRPQPDLPGRLSTALEGYGLLRRCRGGALVAEVMDVKSDKGSEAADGALTAVNEVRLVGRVSRDPEERVLPSGDRVWTFRLVVGRPEDRRSRQSVDALECAVWGGRVRSSVATWAADDVVEVGGSLRRRFFSTGTGRASRVEVEVVSGRIVRRAGVSRRAASG
jgi:single-strand DNA-binding protein